MEGHQRARWALQLQPRRFEIHLHHRSGPHRALVVQLQRHLHGRLALLQAQFRPGKAAVGEPEAKGVSGAVLVALQPPVAMPEVVGHLQGSRFEVRQMRRISRNGKGQVPRGGHMPKQYIRQGMATFLAGIPEQQQPSHVLIPGQGEDRSAPHQRHHGVGIGGGHGLDQSNLIGGQMQISAIPAGEVSPRRRRGVAGDPGHGAAHRRPPGLEALAAQEFHQPLRRRHQRQDRCDVAGVDVLALQAPIEAGHHQSRIALRSGGSGAGGVVTVVAEQAKIRCRPP